MSMKRKRTDMREEIVKSKAKERGGELNLKSMLKCIDVITKYKETFVR